MVAPNDTVKTFDDVVIRPWTIVAFYAFSSVGSAQAAVAVRVACPRGPQCDRGRHGKSAV